MRRLAITLLAASVSSAAGAQPFLPTERAAIELVRGRHTDSLATVERTLAYAERATGGAFSRAGYRFARRPGEPYARVQICYRLGIDPPTCGLDYLVTVDPPHAEPAERFHGLTRDLEHGPRAFLRALAREADLQRQPEILRQIRSAVEAYDPYDWR